MTPKRINTSSGIMYLVILLFGLNPLTSQSRSAPTENFVSAEQPLTAVLKIMEESYQVFFTYEDQLVEGKYVDFTLDPKESLERAMRRLLADTKLAYRPFGDKFWVIYAKSSTRKDILNSEASTGRSISVKNDRESNDVIPGRRKAQMTLSPLTDRRAVKILDVPIGGIVVDNAGNPLIGVNILVKGTGLGTITDVDGRFNLDVEDRNKTLVISYIGYQTIEVPINGRSEIRITLAEDISQLNEVVVVGYGSMKKSDLTGAVSSISAEDLSESPGSNLIEQSQGRLAGVDIVRSNGAPGSGTQIRIRGNRSINASNEPLFVIDGIPTTLSIDDFNPNDIESMEVLKDASAVAIYGSRGANGVILITTKKGKAGRPVISYDGYYGFKEAHENIDLMNVDEYARFARVANGVDPNDASQDASFLGPILADNIQRGVSTNWLGEVLQTGAQQDHQLSIRGGNESVRYYLSGGYFDEQGLIRNSDFSRYSLRVNVDAILSDKLTVGISSTASSDTRNVMANNPYNASLQYVPVVEPYDENGNIIAFPNPNEGLVRSPLLEYAPGQYVNNTRGYRVFANVYGELALTNDLKFRLNFGPDLQYSRRGFYTGDTAGDATQGSITNNQNFAYTLENILTFDKTVNDHYFNLVGLFSVQENKFEVSSLSGRGIPIGRSTFNNLGSAAEITGINSDLSEWGLLSYMARLNYRFKGRYLLTASGRADGSSRLAEGNKWAFFPAVSLGWILSEEDFMPEGNTLSFLKFRASYGEVGNTSINPFQTLGGLGRTIYAFGDDGAFGFGQSDIANPDLKWEISRTFNFGIDFGFFNNRLSGSIELYDTNTDDLLLSRLLPITSGFQSILQNIGATRNRGWEFTVSANVIDNRSSDFSWDVDFNMFSNREEIVELFNGFSDDVGNRWFIGQPINVFYDFQFDGIWQTNEADQAQQLGQQPGDIRIADVNGRGPDGELTKMPDGIINTDDRTIIGSTVPDWSGGLNNRISYKGVDFSILIYTRQGQTLSSGFHNLGGNRWEGRFSAINLNYWTPNNPSNEVPTPRAGGQPLYQSSIRYFDGSFVKIRSISLGYTLPNKLLSGLGISSLKIYGLATNPVIFAPYDIVDPETSNGVVGGGSPLTSATYLFGIKLKL